MGNCTAVIKKTPRGIGAADHVIADISLSSSYATGGDTVPLSILGVRSIQGMMLCSGATTPGGHAVEVIYGATEQTAPLLRVRDAATGAQLTNATDNSAQSIRVVVYANYPYI